MFFIQGLLVALFLFASSIKIFGWLNKIYDPQLAFFHRYGLNRAAMFAVGVIEATGAMVMLVGMMTEDSLLSAVGASFIAFTSVCAIFFHFRFDTWKDAIPSIVTLLLSVLILSPQLEML